MENTSKPANVAAIKHTAHFPLANKIFSAQRPLESCSGTLFSAISQFTPKVLHMLRSFAGHQPQIPSSSYVDLSAQVIGNVHVGEQSSIWMNAVLRGDVHSITLGDRTNVQDNAVLHGQRGLWPVVVGNGCTVGHGAIVHGCVLADDVLVGMGAIILNGAQVGAGSIIAAGAVVTEGAIIPPGSLVAGVPARIRRALLPADLDLIRTYAQNYIDYTALYLSETVPSTTSPALQQK